MNKEISTSFAIGNKPKPLCTIEPLDGTLKAFIAGLETAHRESEEISGIKMWDCGEGLECIVLGFGEGEGSSDCCASGGKNWGWGGELKGLGRNALGGDSAANCLDWCLLLGCCWFCRSGLLCEFTLCFLHIDTGRRSDKWGVGGGREEEWKS